MSVAIHPIQVATGHDEEGVLVMVDERLVAVFVRLDETNELAPGQWFLEAGFGRLAGAVRDPFPDLDEAIAWVTAQMAQNLTTVTS